jgi:SAM-dependent methyltransferase
LPFVITDSERRWSGSMSEAYERWLAPIVFEPFAADLARRAAAQQPRRVLEVAAGTGVVTRRLRSVLPSAQIIATDLNEAMVEFGRRTVPGVTWQQADALDLPFESGVADAIVCQFGVMFFPNKRAALAEMRRALAPAGTLLLSTWDGVTTHEFADALVAALERAFPQDPPSFVAAVPHGYADPQVLTSDVRAAGFCDIEVETITLVSPPTTAADIAAGFCTGTPLRAAIEARGDLAELTERVADALRRELGSGQLTGRMTAHVLQAASP